MQGAAVASLSESSPVWVTLLVGLGGALIGALASIGGQLVAAHWQDKREERDHLHERVLADEAERARLQGLLFDSKRDAFRTLTQLLSERRGVLVDVITLFGVGDIAERQAGLIDQTHWYERWRAAVADAQLLDPNLSEALRAAFEALTAIQRNAEMMADWATLEPLIRRAWSTTATVQDQMRTSMGINEVS